MMEIRVCILIRRIDWKLTNVGKQTFVKSPHIANSQVFMINPHIANRQSPIANRKSANCKKKKYVFADLRNIFEEILSP
jgi:hypothetical protein